MGVRKPLEVFERKFGITMKPIDFLKIQMELEGILLRDDTFITRLNPEVSEFPLVLFASTSDKQKLVCFDDTLSTELCNKLIAGSLISFKAESAIQIFDTYGIHTKTGNFRTYTFPDSLVGSDSAHVKIFSQDDPKVAAYGFNGFPGEVYAVEQEGRIVSACVSSRQNRKSAEAWVFTHPEHRRQGLAEQVVRAWAESLQRLGMIPFYSHEVGNTNSASLARKLNLLHLFDETVIERST
jgi:hypothetical protein